MTVMFAACWARADLLRAIGFLASNLHEWGETQDRRLFRLMCYVNKTLQLRLIAFIGDEPSSLELVAYSDADFRRRPERLQKYKWSFHGPVGKELILPVMCSIEKARVRISLDIGSRSGGVERCGEDDADPVARPVGENAQKESIAHSVRGQSGDGKDHSFGKV